MISNLHKKYSIKILNCTLILQRHNRCVVERNFCEDLFLILLSAYKELNLKELTEYLNCQQAHLSQVAKKLLKQKLIAERKDKEDLRFRFYQLTEQGKKRVLELDQNFDPILHELFSDFPKTEVIKLTYYVAKLNDAANIKPQIQRAHEHIFRSEQRRLAALIGVVGKAIFNLQVSSTEYHALEILSQYNGLISIKDIASELGLLPSHASILIKEFHSLNYIKYTNHPYDSRSNLLELTKIGIQKYHSHRKILENFISRSLASFTVDELESFAELFAKILNKDFLVEEILAKDNYKYRKDIIDYCFLNNSTDSLPEYIAGESARIFALKTKTGFKAFLQVKGKNNNADILCWSPDLPLYRVAYLLRESLISNKININNNLKPFNLFSKSLEIL